MAFHWISSSVSQGLPMGGNVVSAGNDADGSPIYVGRAFHEGENLPAKVIPSKHSCFISHGGSEIFKQHFEFLSGTGFTWIASSNGHAPAGAVSTGTSRTGETLFIGRTHYEGSVTPGKIVASHGCMYFSFSGAEQSTFYYEVLCCKTKSNWSSISAHDALPLNAIYAGNDFDGSAIYVGRAYHNTELLPAKVIPSKNVAYVTWNGQEIPVYHYEILCNGNVHWIPSQNGASHPNAVVGGKAVSGETLFIGRAHHHGTVTPGKIQPSHGALYIAFRGQEVAVTNYEILVEY